MNGCPIHHVMVHWRIFSSPNGHEAETATPTIPRVHITMMTRMGIVKTEETPDRREGGTPQQTQMQPWTGALTQGTQEPPRPRVPPKRLHHHLAGRAALPRPLTPVSKPLLHRTCRFPILTTIRLLTILSLRRRIGACVRRPRRPPAVTPRSQGDPHGPNPLDQPSKRSQQPRPEGPQHSR